MLCAHKSLPNWRDLLSKLRLIQSDVVLGALIRSIKREKIRTYASQWNLFWAFFSHLQIALMIRCLYIAHFFCLKKMLLLPVGFIRTSVWFQHFMRIIHTGITNSITCAFKILYFIMCASEWGSESGTVCSQFGFDRLQLMHASQ